MQFPLIQIPLAALKGNGLDLVRVLLDEFLSPVVSGQGEKPGEKPFRKKGRHSQNALVSARANRFWPFAVKGEHFFQVDGAEFRLVADGDENGPEIRNRFENGRESEGNPAAHSFRKLRIENRLKRESGQFILHRLPPRSENDPKIFFRGGGEDFFRHETDQGFPLKGFELLRSAEALRFTGGKKKKGDTLGHDEGERNLT